jgi:hypothetical protein
MHWFGSIGLGSAVIALFGNPSQFSSSLGLEVYRAGPESGICQQVPKLSPKNKQVEQYVREKVDSDPICRLRQWTPMSHSFQMGFG